MIVMGMDPSLTSFGVAYRDVGGRLCANRISTPGNKRGSERLDYLETTVAYYLDKYKPEVVAYEDYAYGKGPRNSNNLFGIGELGGVIKLLLYRRGVAILTVPPTSLKLFATGSGRAEKSDVAAFIQETEGVTFATSDQSDAAALLKLGEMATHTTMRPRLRTHPQRRAIAGCQWL